MNFKPKFSPIPSVEAHSPSYLAHRAEAHSPSYLAHRAEILTQSLYCRRDGALKIRSWTSIEF